MAAKRISNGSLFLIIIVAAIFFTPLFIFRQVGPFDFWWWMSANLIILISLSLFLDRGYFDLLKKDFTQGTAQKILLGIVSAAILYGVFWIGNLLSREWFGFADEGIAGVYDFKGNAAFARIMIFMLLIIGPGEEFFWRGALQRWFSERLGGWKGFIIATLFYTAVHVFSGNIMLIVAAFVAGVFWGWMYLRYRSILANVISHTLWDISVFLLFPFQ